MQENLTLEQEEIVHENPCIHFEIKNKFLRVAFYIICLAGLFSPVFLAQYFGV